MNRRIMMAVKKDSGGLLPSEYQQVEWIQSNMAGGRPFIDTSFIPHVSDEIYIKFSPLSLGNQECVFSAGTGTYQFVVIHQGNSTSYIRAFSNSADNYTLRYGDNAELEMRSYRDGGTYKTVFRNITANTQRTYTNNVIANLDGSSTNFYLFRRRNDATYFAGKIFVFWAKDSNGNYLANYIPCYRKSDNEIGMYDTVSKAFFASANTGTFTKGADVN